MSVLFDRCLAKGDDPQGDTCSSKLFQHELGYEEDSAPVFFSKTRIEQNKKNIFYLLGQLRAAHGNLGVNSAEAIYRYDAVKWTSDTVKLMELYYLGEIAKGITPFIKQSNTATIRPTSVKPTLSPKDPAFPAWWAEHKAEWGQ